MATMTITLTARDVMNPEVLSVQDDMTVQELAAFLIDHEISGAPVKDRAGKVVGVVSFTDIALATPEDGRLKRVRPEPDFFVRGWEEELEPEEMARLHLVGEGLQVSEIMTPAVYAVEEHTPLGEVARMMREGHLHRLLVLREGTLVGILTTSDLLKVLAETESVVYEKVSGASFTEAVEHCRRVLAAEGFGILTEIDLQATLEKKLGIEVGPYLILGACHPPSAHRAVTAAPEVGVLLPCNVTVSVEGGRTVVRAMNPRAALALIPSPEVAAVAAQVGAALQRVVTTA